MRRSVWVTLFLCGCSGPDEGQPPGQGGAQAGGGPAGGQSAGGAGMAALAGKAGAGGGSAGGGGSPASGGSSCAERWAEYDVLARAARLCDPSSATPQCKFDVVVLDSCGCSVPANGSSPEYGPARQRLVPYAEDCEFPEPCVGCPATLQAGCQEIGTGVGQCVYQ